MAEAVLDASAMLAFLRNEPGAQEVEDVLVRGALMSAANWAEVLSWIAERQGDAEQADAELDVPARLVEIVPFERQDAVAAARFRPLTRDRGLDLGDRACLGLAQRRGVRVLTADRAWEGLNLGIEIRLIR